jgi:biotin carboxyl carrier protein
MHALARVLLCAGCSLVPLFPAQGESIPPKPELPIPLQVSIPTPPVVFRGEGQRRLCYEIYITNLSPETWAVQSIKVQSNGGSHLLSVGSKEVSGVLRHPARKPNDKAGHAEEIAPGETVIAYMWVNLANDARLPAGLRHVFVLQKRGENAERELDAPTTQVLNKDTEIASPLRGKNWVAGNGPSNTSVHRRTFIVIDGTPHIAQRYAIDWVQIGEDNKTYRGDAKDNHSYHCFGADALAVADGLVVEVKDGIPENTPNAASMAVPITLATIAGNHVNLDLGGGVYAMYAHLQPGSVRVTLGERVKRGQVIGLVGNTGNSSEPHLHFQLMDRNSPLGSEGLPYALPEYVVRGKGEADTGKMQPLRTPQTYRREIPLEDEVLEFE